MGLKNQEWVREMLLYGTSILGVEWRKGKPWIENIALRDFFVDPTSTGLVKTRNPAEYAGLQYLIRKETAKRERIYDAEKDEMVARYTGLDDLTPANSSGNIGKDTGDNSSMDKAFKDLFNGSTLGDEATKDQIHVIKLHHIPTGRIYEIGNRKKFIYNKPTWCQRREITEEVQVEVEGQIINTTRKLDEIEPFLPFAVLRDYIDSSQFYGRGEMAVIMSDAELLNDYESMDVDNNAYQNTPMYWIDPQFADLAPEIETIPGAVYPIPQNAMGALERPQLSGDLDNKKDRIAERMRRATAADEAVQGVGQQKGRVTATEVSTQLAQAQNRFSTKLSNLESEGYAQLGSVIFKLVQIFVTNETAVRIVGKKGVHFKDYDPWEFNGEWEAHVKLDTTIKREQMEVGQKQNQMFLALDAQAGIFDPIELARYKVQTINSEFTDEQFNAMLAKAAPPKPSDTEIKAQIDIQKSELSAIAGIYDNAGPNIKVQIEEKLGLEPDVQHEGDAHNRMLEQANAGADFVNPTTDASNGTLPGMDAILNPEPTPPPSGTKKPA